VVISARSADNDRMKGKAAPAEDALTRLATAVVERRSALGLTQEAAAHEAGIALRTYQNLEAGVLNPGYLTLGAVARGLEVRLSVLIRKAEQLSPGNLSQQK
jgi:transcriptional regulator with XRE-family HTH domain